MNSPDREDDAHECEQQGERSESPAEACTPAASSKRRYFTAGSPPVVHLQLCRCITAKHRDSSDVILEALQFSFPHSSSSFNETTVGPCSKADVSFCLSSLPDASGSTSPTASMKVVRPYCPSCICSVHVCVIVQHVGHLYSRASSVASWCCLCRQDTLNDPTEPDVCGPPPVHISVSLFMSSSSLLYNNKKSNSKRETHCYSVRGHLIPKLSPFSWYL